MCVLFTFKINLRRFFFVISLKNVHQTNLRNVCLSSSLYVYVLTPAYSSLCRVLEYLLKVRCIILVDRNGTGFFIPQDCFLLWNGNTVLCLKNISYKWVVIHIFTKLSLNLYLIYLYTITFFANFAQNWRIFMSEVLNLHQTFIYCVFDVDINISLS